jgi:thioredoxin reductase (NADPH)
MMEQKRSFFIITAAIVLLIGIIGVLKARKQCDINNALGKDNIVHILVVGSGPAGSSAALYGARLGRDVVVPRGPKPGGLLRDTSDIENWPGTRTILGSELVDSFEHHAQSFGATYLSDTVESIDFNQWPIVVRTSEGAIIHALTVIIATGATPLMLGVPGEQEYWGNGVSSCAKCDGFFYKNREVVVVGGGDSAIEEAIQLAPYAKKITVLVRKEAMRAAHATQDKLAAYPSIEVVYNTEVSEILGSSEDGVTGVKLFDNQTKKTREIAVDGVFLAIGHKPNTELFSPKNKGTSGLALDKNGYIKMVDGRSQKTSVPGVFAAGDVEDGYYRQAIVASGSGVRAAIDADHFLAEIGLTAKVAQEMSPRLFGSKRSARLSEPVSVLSSKDMFDQLIKSDKLTVIDFFKDDCPQCVQLEPLFDGLAQEYAGQAQFAKADAEQYPELCEHYFVYRVPCILFFKDGQLVARYGAQVTKEDLSSAIKKFI